MVQKNVKIIAEGDLWVLCDLPDPCFLRKKYLNRAAGRASIMMAGVKDVLERAKQGDMDAFAELFEPLRGKVFAVACRMLGPQDAEDVVMDTYLRAWKALPGFRGTCSLKTWLMRIARNRSLDVIRSRRTVPVMAELDAPGEEGRPALMLDDPGQPRPDETVADREDSARAAKALAQLDDEHRLALQLRYQDELSYSEIAAATGVRIGTVMSRLFNGRRKLLRAMNDMDEGKMP